MSLLVEQLQHSYPRPELSRRPVLDIAHWQLSAGEQVLLRGVSGSGKTTLLNILAGLLRPARGEVVVDGYRLFAHSEAARDRFRAGRIGYVFQMHHLIGNLTARENVEMPLVFAGQGDYLQRRKAALHLLERLGLAEVADRRPIQMSTGQRLRVTVARSLVTRPHLLLADEPTAALDSCARDGTIHLLQEVCREREAILIVASHDPALERRFDRTVDLRESRLHETAANPFRQMTTYPALEPAA